MAELGTALQSYGSSEEWIQFQGKQLCHGTILVNLMTECVLRFFKITGNLVVKYVFTYTKVRLKKKKKKISERLI